VHSFYPIANRKMTLTKESAYNVGDGANASLGFAILRGSMRPGKTKNNDMLRKERAKRVIIKFSPVITLNTLNRQAKLHRNILIEFMNSERDIRFKTQRKCPSISRVIIN
jgi:hypothetical protein